MNWLIALSIVIGILGGLIGLGTAIVKLVDARVKEQIEMETRSHLLRIEAKIENGMSRLVNELRDDVAKLAEGQQIIQLTQAKIVATQEERQEDWEQLRRICPYYTGEGFNPHQGD